MVSPGAIPTRDLPPGGEPRGLLFSNRGPGDADAEQLAEILIPVVAKPAGTVELVPWDDVRLDCTLMLIPMLKKRGQRRSSAGNLKLKMELFLYFLVLKPSPNES